MISTDGVKQAADDLDVIESQPIVDELNRLQSQEFLDPNCNPNDPEYLDVSRESFCDDPLEAIGRGQRLADFMAGLPVISPGPDQSICAQAAITKLTDLIKKKFSFSTLQIDTEKNKFAEEKFEAQLMSVLYVSSFVYALGQVSKKVPILIDQTKTLLTTLIDALNAVETTDHIAVFERQYAIDRLTESINRLDNIPEDKTVFDVRLAPTSEFVGAQIDILNDYTSRLLISQSGNYYKLKKTVAYNQRKPQGGFGAVYKKAGDRLIKSQQPSIDDYYTDLIDFKTDMMNGSYSTITQSNSHGYIKRYAYYSKGTPDVDKAGVARSTITFLEDACTDLADFYNSYVTETPKTPTQEDVFKEISQIDFCGTKLPAAAPTEDVTPDSPNSPDLKHNTFDVDNKPTVTELKYWQRYARYLTLANLVPAYWTIGLYIPSSSGIVKVPLPTIWKPLFVINAKPYGLIVIFLTINGIAISPTIWVWKFPPFGKNESNLVVMLRAFNKKIKDDTGDALLNVPVVDGININPTLTKSLPFKQDDLPTIKRLGLNNPPYLLYLTQWLKQYKTGGGLP